MSVRQIEGSNHNIIARPVPRQPGQYQQVSRSQTFSQIFEKIYAPWKMLPSWTKKVVKIIVVVGAVYITAMVAKKYLRRVSPPIWKELNSM